ncbi:hypothetical protein ACJQWK_11478 [Exserohilum turcicum]
MPRNKHQLTIDTAYANMPYVFTHASNQKSASSKETPSPDDQTFLLSPTSSEGNFYLESPVLPQSRRENPFATPNISDISTGCGSFQTFQTLADELLISQPNTASHMVDILPDSASLYAEEEFHEWDWQNVQPDAQQPCGIEVNVSMDPEVQGPLPIIHDEDFPYYPLPSGTCSSEKAFEGEQRPRGKKEKRRLVRRGVWGFGIKKFLRCVFRRYGVKRV